MSPQPEAPTNEAKSAALFGAKITVQHEDGGSEQLDLRPLPLRSYAAAVAALDDELTLVGILVGRDRAWVESLTPESYETLYAALERLNAKGFFAWSARQRARQEDAQRRTLEALAALPPEAVESVARLGQASISPTSLPTSLPKRG